MPPPAGVNVYLQEDGTWQRQQLHETAQALAVGLWDLNDDSRLDIWVGNDFDEYDRVWLQAADGTWQPADLFEDTSHSTMGIDRGDLDNNGSAEYFATDMKPSTIGPQVIAQWVPLMNAAEKTRLHDDPQLSENVLQFWRGDRFVNEGYERKIDATGWSWSGKFGDLDNDGALDLYVVNGMIAGDLLHYLPGGELVEENQALRNDGSGDFMPATEWGLGSTRSGRGMSMADFDGDGDLDIVVNNLNSPAQLFENRLCSAGTSVEVDLRWPDSANPFALGAVATLHTDRGTLVRDVRAVSGYLSGDSTRPAFWRARRRRARATGDPLAGWRRLPHRCAGHEPPSDDYPASGCPLILRRQSHFICDDRILRCQSWCVTINGFLRRLTRPTLSASTRAACLCMPTGATACPIQKTTRRPSTLRVGHHSAALPISLLQSIRPTPVRTSPSPASSSAMPTACETPC